MPKQPKKRATGRRCPLNAAPHLHGLQLHHQPLRHPPPYLSRIRRKAKRSNTALIAASLISETMRIAEAQHGGRSGRPL